MQSDSPALARRVGFVSSMGIYLAKGSTKRKKSKKKRKKNSKWFALGGLPDVCLENFVLPKARGGGVARRRGKGGRH